MDEENHIPLLFSFYFGNAAAAAQRGASRRLMKWSRAFEQWIEERRRDYQKDTVKQAVMAWRRLVRQCGKMPWQMTREDIEQHMAWMEQEGLAKSTINCAVGIIARFYTWCDVRRVDSACERGFNPAKHVERIKASRYEKVSMWSREEMMALLNMLSRDETELGKREQAFFMSRIYLGVPTKSLLHLRWGQIAEDGAGGWVRWRHDGEKNRLPDMVWQAVRDYLRASGRLEGMRAEKFVFAPLAEPGKEENGGKAEDWAEGRQLSGKAILDSLKIYGKQLGISEEKLNLMALRRSAIRLRMDQGESLEGMKTFMDSEEGLRSSKYRLGKLPEMAGKNDTDTILLSKEVEVPSRRAKPFKEGEHIAHGFYSHRKDIQAVREVMAEDIQGMEDETAGLKRLMRGLLELEGDETKLAEAYSQAAHRLGELVCQAEPLKQGMENPWAEQFLSFVDEIEQRNGRLPISPQVREEAIGVGSDMAEASGSVTEEIATIRLLLRNAYRRAMSGIERREYLRIVDLYSLGCGRLARLLKIGGDNGNGRLERNLRKAIDEAIRQLNQEWRLEGEG